MANPPKRFGMILYDGFQLIDVCGPLDVLNVLSTRTEGVSLSLIAEDTQPKSTFPKEWPANMGMAPFTTSQTLQPTHTFESAPELDVLIVPGGMGSFDPARQGQPNSAVVDPIVKFVLERYPKLQYLLTVCTGSGIVSQSGLLDGKNATLFKGAWEVIPQWRPSVQWQPRARWTVDGNIWTSSGVASGIDLMFAFVKHIHGEEIVRDIAGWMEYRVHEDPANDPFGIDVST
ncbi:class I glutamine amidotransferase-like protein [Exophiala viscosa]|uniref:Class I glutamine amidotransferase-like protein n=1 Tax=Exophiala viscosa TaxID=2486360 RepID=A0AAN6E1W4_9EURO|nr:class I glutamine amidotransferase-like protein [Exophiala viscosa]KAI1630158.1 class I glutamine amidotransferase-like protein [Exophiala viscosa]